MQALRLSDNRSAKRRDAHEPLGNRMEFPVVLMSFPTSVERSCYVLVTYPRATATGWATSWLMRGVCSDCSRLVPVQENRTNPEIVQAPCKKNFGFPNVNSSKNAQIQPAVRMKETFFKLSVIRNLDQPRLRKH